MQVRGGIPWSAGQRFPSSEREFASRHPLHDIPPGPRPGDYLTSSPTQGPRNLRALRGDQGFSGCPAVPRPRLPVAVGRITPRRDRTGRASLQVVARTARARILDSATVKPAGIHDRAVEAQ